MKPYNVIVSIPGHYNSYEIAKKVDLEQEGGGNDFPIDEVQEKKVNESNDKKQLIQNLPTPLAESFKRPRLIETASIIFPREKKRKIESKEGHQGFGKTKMIENQQNSLGSTKSLKHKFQFF